MEAITAFLSSKGITKSNGKLAVHIHGDALPFDKQKELTDPNSGVEALIFKQSISLGWDCPRAQFMLLTRDVSNSSSIFTDQLLGRIQRQVFGKARGVDIIDTAYVYSMCGAVEITRQSGVEVEDDDTICVADTEQLHLWKSAGARRTVITREKRSGITAIEYTNMLDEVTLTGKLSGDYSKLDISVAGEQEVSVGSIVDMNMNLSNAYVPVLKSTIQKKLKDCFEECGVKANGKAAEVAIEPYVKWFKSNVNGVCNEHVEASIVADITDAGRSSLTIQTMLSFGKLVAAKEQTKERNGYSPSEYMNYVPVDIRYRPKTDTVAMARGVRLLKYSGELLSAHLYGTPVSGMNTESEQNFEDTFLTDLSRNKNSSLVSWFRNDPRLDSFGTAFSLAYKKSVNEWASVQMFPDYMLLVRSTNGDLIPLAIEVKGTGKDGKPADGSGDGSIDQKASRLAEQTSNDDAAYGSREDSVDKNGKIVAYGRGKTIGALVFQHGGAWKVYGQGVPTELSVWMKTQGLNV